MRINSYLSFSGNCKEAFHFYAEALGGKIEMMVTHGETPAAEHTPAGWQTKIIHARLSLGGTTLMGADVPPEHYHTPKGSSVTLLADTPEEAERAFANLSKGANVTQAMQQTFFGRRFGTLRDQFAIPWMVICE